MLKAQDVIVFFAIVALFHSIHAAPLSFPQDFTPTIGSIDATLQQVKSGIKSSLAQGEKLVETVQERVASWVPPFERAEKSASDSEESPSPSALELKSGGDIDTTSPGGTEVPLENPSA